MRRTAAISNPEIIMQTEVVQLPADEDQLLNAKQAAALLSISEKKLWSLTKAGEVPRLIVGERSVRYSRRALNRYVDRQMAASAS